MKFQEANNPLHKLETLDVESLEARSKQGSMRSDDMESRDSARFGDSQIGSDDMRSNIKNLYSFGKRAEPFLGDTMSEIYDDKEKKAVFNHSLRDGVFNDIKNSPLKAKMPF